MVLEVGSPRTVVTARAPAVNHLNLQGLETVVVLEVGSRRTVVMTAMAQ